MSNNVVNFPRNNILHSPIIPPFFSDQKILAVVKGLYAAVMDGIENNLKASEDRCLALDVLLEYLNLHSCYDSIEELEEN